MSDTEQKKPNPNIMIIGLAVTIDGIIGIINLIKADIKGRDYEKVQTCLGKIKRFRTRKSN